MANGVRMRVMNVDGFDVYESMASSYSMSNNETKKHASMNEPE